MKGIIACGHRLTAKAAAEMLKSGGNAFDAAVAACFASSITEPMLTSLGGGGLALIHLPDGQTKCVDFLPGFPQKAKSRSCKDPVKTLAGTFYIGYDTNAVPGTLNGLLHIHERYGSLGMEKIVEPAIGYAREGVALDRVQAYICKDICEEFCMYTEEGREIFAPEGEMLKEGETIRNRKTADFLEMLGADLDAALAFYYDSIERTIEGKDSVLTVEETKSYRIQERDPILIGYRDHDVLLSPPPSAGGILIAHALNMMRDVDVASLDHNSLKHIDLLADVLRECDSDRTREFYAQLHEDGFWRRFLQGTDNLGSTTHISITDGDGNAVGMTTSNGTSSGVFIEGTGILLNNFVGEPDLMQFRETYKPGDRIASMMSPTMIRKSGRLAAVLGTGGSERIRSAILQVASNLVDFGMKPQQATDASRIHFGNDLLQIEPGIDKQVIDELGKKYKIKLHEEKKYYFGGVHIATPEDGAGDHRRDGAVLRV